MRNTSIGGKLLAIPIATAFVLIVAGVWIIRSHAHYEHSIQAAMNQELADRRELIDAFTELSGTHLSFVKDMESDGTAVARRETNLNALASRVRAMEEVLRAQADNDDPLDPRVSALTAARADLSAYHAAIRDYAAGRIKSSPDLDRLLQRMSGAHEALSWRVMVLLQSQRASSLAAIREAEQSVIQDWVSIGFLVLLIIAVVLGGSRAIAGSITRRLDSLLAATKAVAEDPSATPVFDMSSNDEFTELARGLSVTLTRIRERDAELREAAGKAHEAQRVLQSEVEYRRKVAANLRSTADFLEMAQTAGGFGIFDLDLLNGRIQGSAVFFELLGIQTEERFMTREQWLCTIHPEDLASCVQRFGDAVLAGGQYETDYRALRPDGSIRWLTGRGRVMRDSLGQAQRVIGTVTDITARRELEDRLRKTTESLTIAQTSAGVATFDMDVLADTLLCSENYFELLHIPPRSQPMDQEEFLAHVHPADAEMIRNPRFQYAGEAEFYHREYRILLEDGSPRWISEKANVTRTADGRLRRVTGAIMDVTDLKFAEAALHAAEKRLERAVRGTQDGLWEYNVAEDSMWLAPRFEEMLGYAPGEIGTQVEPLMELVHPDDRAQVRSLVERHIKHDAIFDIEYRVKSKLGDYEWVRARARADRESDGNAIKVAGSIQLVTDRRAAQQATLEAVRVAEAANRAKSDFLANMSHEIRTPMNGVIGVAQLLNETSLDKIQREYVHIIRGSAETLLSLINDILDFSKIEAGALELEHIPFDLRSVVYETASALALPGGMKGIELIVNVSADVPYRLYGDPGRLRQVMTNLISNALKFTHEGHVLVSITRLGGSEFRSTIKIEVTDTGIGIAPERMDKLFKPFSQVDSSTTRHYGGTGLGLSIVKRMAELMGGRVGVRSEQGSGSTFWITLDLELDGVQPTLADLGKGRRVLVVDDLDPSRAGLCQKFRAFNFDPVAASSVAEALGILSREKIELVLADELMPVRGGMELLAAMRADPSLRSIPFILMSMIGANLQEVPGGYRPDLVVLKPLRGRTVGESADSLLAGNAQRGPLPALPGTPDTQCNGSRVLLVEDNAVNQQVARRLLQKLGAEVITCSNGAEALEHIEADAPFDAVLMDCQMPVMDGFTATRHLREREAATGAKRLPVIALTANVMREDRERCIQAGMDAHLGKPLQYSQLRECLLRYVPSRSAPAVDMVALRELTGGDAEFQRDLINTFIASGDSHLADIVEALRRKDYPVIARRAHALKGSSANIRAEELSATAMRLEAAASKAAEGEVPDLVDQLGARLTEVTRLLRNAG